MVDGRDDCEYAGDGVLGTGERAIGRGDSEGMKNLTCFLGLACSTGVEMGLVCLAIGGERMWDVEQGVWAGEDKDLYIMSEGESGQRHRSHKPVLDCPSHLRAGSVAKLIAS